MNDDENIFLYKTCMNPDDQYIGHCYHCKVDYCQYSCRKGIIQKIDKLEKNINDIKFINPIPGRSYERVKKISKWKWMIGNIYKELSDNVDTDARNVGETAHLLHSQMKALYEKWKYTED